MKSKDIKDLITYRLERSKESIKAAEIMLEKGMLIFSMNRIYYSMFYAVQALLVLHGLSFSKHGQVKGYFNRELIKTGVFPLDMGRMYNTAFEYRQKFDYVDFAIPDKQLVSECINKAKEFHTKINEYMQIQESLCSS